MDKEKKENKNPKKKENESLKEELEKAKLETKKWQNEYYKAYADMQNLRRDIEKDHHEAIKYRAEGFVNELLGVLDAFYVALNGEVQSEEVKNYLVGFKYIYKNLVAALENEGVKELTPKVGDKFDPNIMEALETKESDGEENLILEVKAKGYQLHDRLIRPAIVVVSKKKDENETKENNEEKAPAMDA